MPMPPRPTSRVMEYGPIAVPEGRIIDEDSRLEIEELRFFVVVIGLTKTGGCIRGVCKPIGRV